MSVSGAVPVPPALVALRVIEKIPAADGVPLITPVEVSTVKFAGSSVALKLVGLLVAVI